VDFLNRNIGEIALFSSGEEDDVFNWRYAEKVRKLRNISWIKEITNQPSLSLDPEVFYDLDPEIDYDKEAILEFIQKKDKTDDNPYRKDIFDDEAPNDSEAMMESQVSNN